MNMKTVYIAAEGQAEANVVNRVLYPYFIQKDINLIPHTIVTSTDYRHGRVYKGGITTYASARNTIVNCLSAANATSGCFATTMIDYYGLPADTPGIQATQRFMDPYDKVRCVEDAIRFDLGADDYKFFPYIQLHELESLQFVNIDSLAHEYFDYNLEPLRQCVAEQSNPELINNSPETAPSKRILECIPNFDKNGAGVDCLIATGLDELRERCKHFGEWIAWIESLAD